MSPLKCYKFNFCFLSLLVCSSCLQQDFGAPRKSTQSMVTSSNELTTEKIDSFQKEYPDFDRRSLEAFKRTVHPLLMKSCGGCHTSTSSSAARSKNHSDSDPEKAHAVASAIGLFDLKNAPNSDIFHLRERHQQGAGVDIKNLTGSPFDPSVPGSASLRWVVAIQNYSILLGDLPKRSISRPVALSSELYEAMKKASDSKDRSKELPLEGVISVANLPENAAGSGLLNLKFTVSVEADGFYRVSDLSLQSDVTTNLLKIEGIDVLLNGKKISTASSFRPYLPYRVFFSSSDKPEVFTGSAAAMVAPEVDATKCGQGETARCKDFFSLEFRGMKWEPRTPSPTPTPPSVVTDYPNTRRLAAMTVLKNKCSGCHGLGGNSGGAFPGSTNLDTATDSTWTATMKWVLPGDPTNSPLMQRLTLVSAGGPVINSTKTKNMPQGRPALSLEEVYALNDWILLMTEKTTFRFQIPAGTKASSTGNWNTPQSPLSLKIGDTLFVRNLDTFNHAIHTNNSRPFSHQTGETVGCSSSAPCGSSRFSVTTAADSIPEPQKTKDQIYDHLRQTGKTGSIYLIVKP